MVESEDIRLAFEDKEDYDKLTSKSSPFWGKQFREVFMLALAIGFINNKRKKLTKRIPNIHSIALNREEKWLINCVAVSTEKNIEVLLDPKKVFLIVEEYANWGIKVLLKEIMEETADYDKVLEGQLRKVISKSK